MGANTRLIRDRKPIAARGGQTLSKNNLAEFTTGWRKLIGSLKWWAEIPNFEK